MWVVTVLLLTSTPLVWSKYVLLLVLPPLVLSFLVYFFLSRYQKDLFCFSEIKSSFPTNFWPKNANILNDYFYVFALKTSLWRLTQHQAATIIFEMPLFYCIKTTKQKVGRAAIERTSQLKNSAKVVITFCPTNLLKNIWFCSFSKNSTFEKKISSFISKKNVIPLKNLFLFVIVTQITLLY